ncbi:inositol monophosphatase [Nocardia sp. NEAU-351]|uniref:Histidinol-phosphatase n=2 Tax=Nocardia bovistercoris TaxID=2785916 RepID=A0A931IGX8_9NOCA|nr:inositol monophosphatase [Nocardia bovistercoris]
MNEAPDAAVVASATDIAIAAAEEAGAAIRAGLREALQVRAKGADGDLVTQLDLLAEDIILRRLREAFPGHAILAEESGRHGGAQDSWCWVVDPLDGTNNIAVGLPVYSVGIALCHAGTPVVGVVHEPTTDRTWWAVRGGGAFGPHGRIRGLARERKRSAPTLAWLQGYSVGSADPVARGLRLTLEANARRVIQLWSPLLCWMMVSRGDIDGFVGYRAGVIDLPAGSLIARESGIRITDFDGAPLDERIDPADGGVDFLAGTGEIPHDLALLVKSAADVRVSGLAR